MKYNRENKYTKRRPKCFACDRPTDRDQLQPAPDPQPMEPPRYICRHCFPAYLYAHKLCAWMQNQPRNINFLKQ